MRRRDFILASGAMLSWPLIGVLSNLSDDSYESIFPAFHRGLRETRYIEGQNVAIEYRYADGQIDRLPALAADLVNRKSAVLFAVANAAAVAAKTATTTIPVVFVIGGNPVKLGLVGSLNRPAANITGITLFGSQLDSKRLELLREFVPRATLFGVLTNPSQPASVDQETEVEAAARSLGLQVHTVHASSEGDFDTAFTTCVQIGAGGLLVTSDALFFNRHKEIVALAARYAVPAIYEWRDFVLAGGLASYGTNRAEAFHQAGVYTGKILGGAKVTDLPAVQPTKFEFVINLKTAKALGIDVPPMLSARADEVIEYVP